MEIKQLVADIKANGMGYVKSAMVKKEIEEYLNKRNDKSIEITWDSEDRIYILVYKGG